MGSREVSVYERILNSRVYLFILPCVNRDPPSRAPVDRDSDPLAGVVLPLDDVRSRLADRLTDDRLVLKISFSLACVSSKLFSLATKGLPGKLPDSDDLKTLSKLFSRIGGLS